MYQLSYLVLVSEELRVSGAIQSPFESFCRYILPALSNDTYEVLSTLGVKIMFCWLVSDWLKKCIAEGTAHSVVCNIQIMVPGVSKAFAAGF